jgi:hypothetical protein
MHGALTSEVKFFGGLFGYLEKGRTFAVEQEEVSPHFWEVTAMHVHMDGKALLFKTIAVQEDETYSDFHPVPGKPTLPEAAELLKQSVRNLPQTQAKNGCVEKKCAAEFNTVISESSSRNGTPAGSVQASARLPARKIPIPAHPASSGIPDPQTRSRLHEDSRGFHKTPLPASGSLQQFLSHRPYFDRIGRIL